MFEYGGVDEKKGFPWGVVGTIIAFIVLLIGWYFFVVS
jgi:hypothetical protein